MENLAVLRISRLPKYFEPAELRKYLEQFGKVYELYIPKSRKTCRWKDHAFVRMSKEVAPLVASTLNNLLEFNKIIKCEVLANNKRLFRTNRYSRTSTQAVADEQQTVATIKRVTALNARKPLNIPKYSARKSLPVAVRRRARNLQKRIGAIKKVNPNFKFTSVNNK
ncbi:unnamed protein product [Heterobilharzia americana]|nr:unnamed protein product [Heterobilharzia americana]CAH8656956.1 unnamed protein product [Heterobilharzia americana]